VVLHAGPGVAPGPRHVAIGWDVVDSIRRSSLQIAGSEVGVCAGEVFPRVAPFVAFLESIGGYAGCRTRIIDDGLGGRGR
jgi:hypothetical protein